MVTRGGPPWVDRSRKEVGRRKDLSDIQGSGFRRVGEFHAGIGFPQFFDKFLQDRLGVDADEFLSKNAMEQVDVRLRTSTVIDGNTAFF
jgi:hypothetical protein